MVHRTIILQQNESIYQPIEVDNIIYWYLDKQISNTKNIIAICLSEIQSNIEHNCKLGDKKYISPFVNSVGDCYYCRKIVAQSINKFKDIPVIDLSKIDKSINIIFVNEKFEII